MDSQIKIEVSANYLRELIKKHLKETFGLEVKVASIQFHYEYQNYEFERMDKVEISLSFEEYRRLLNIKSKALDLEVKSTAIIK